VCSAVAAGCAAWAPRGASAGKMSSLGQKAVQLHIHAWPVRSKSWAGARAHVFPPRDARGHRVDALHVLALAPHLVHGLRGRAARAPMSPASHGDKHLPTASSDERVPAGSSDERLPTGSSDERLPTASSAGRDAGGTRLKAAAPERVIEPAVGLLHGQPAVGALPPAARRPALSSGRASRLLACAGGLPPRRSRDLVPQVCRRLVVFSRYLLIQALLQLRQGRLRFAGRLHGAVHSPPRSPARKPVPHKHGGASVWASRGRPGHQHVDNTT